MLRFLEDADLVEQERDDINRILFAERKSTCEFPFTVDATAGRPEDEAGCSYGHRSSSESLRGESEVCSNDTRQSPAVSTTVSDVRRQVSFGSNSGRDHQNRPSAQQQQQPSFEGNSVRKNDSQANGSMQSPFLAFQTYGVFNPSAAALSYPTQLVNGQPTSMFPYGMVPQFYPHFGMVQPLQFGHGQFMLPQLVQQRPAVPAIRMPSNSTTGVPNYPPPLSPYFPRFLQSAELCHSTQNIHYSLDSVGSAASYTGTSIIQEDVTANLTGVNAHNSTSASEDFHNQGVSSSSMGIGPVPPYSQRDSTVSPSQVDEDDKRQSCESPTIVIEADQNAAAIASRQRASALMNASSTPVVDSVVMSSAPPPAPEESATPDAEPVPSADTNSTHYRSPTQSPQMADNVGMSGDAGNAPPSSVLVARETDSSAVDIYYDAEDKPAQQVSPPLNSNDSQINVVESGSSTANPELEKGTSDTTAGATVVNENDDSLASSSLTTKQKTWASLFRDTTTANSAIVTRAVESGDESYRKLDDDSSRQRSRSTPFDASQSGDVVSVDRDSDAVQLAAMLRNTEFLNRGPTFILRGIINRGNWCYVNVILQALMACPPFYHFLRNLSSFAHRAHTSTPLLDAFVRLAMEFPLIDRSGRVSNRPLLPLDPTYLHAIITRLKSDASFKGRQEDAEEFLLLVFNVLHDEMVACLSLLEKDRSDPSSRERSVNGDVEDADNSEWQQVGPGRKAAVTRQTKVTQSPLSQLFLGQLRYGLCQPGAKESANLEPFYTLPLDVQGSNVKDVLSALQAFTSKETLKSFAGKNKAEVDATRRITFHELPRVMIFQLKYFVYTEDGLKKIIKPMEYPMDLMLDRDIIFSRKASTSTRQYKLFAVVFHHGEKAEGGHYTVDIFHGGQWMHVDDAEIIGVTNEHVLAFKPPRVPYLLFYRRWDSSASDSQQQQQPSR